MTPGSAERVRTVQYESGEKGLFRHPAIFVSTLSPGYVGGGSQCTLAFLQAVSHLHEGNVTYIGPPFLKSMPVPDVRLTNRIDVEDRSLSSKVQGLAEFRSVDRTTPIAIARLRELRGTGSVVYVNGELAGHVVAHVRQLGLPCIFICQNYAPEYMAAETPRFAVRRRMYVGLGSRAALAGYRNADVCVTLTDEDRQSYEATSGRVLPPQTTLSRCYFGYEDSDGLLPQGPVHTPPERFTVLVNTNMAMRQNEEGVLFVLNQVWPRVHQQQDWRLILAGRYPTRAIQQAAANFDTVELISRPEPLAMEQIFRRAAVYAWPRPSRGAASSCELLRPCGAGFLSLVPNTAPGDTRKSPAVCCGPTAPRQRCWSGFTSSPSANRANCVQHVRRHTVRS